ncbi:hypothetical protein [Streptomyces sp. NPDC059278]|uniref:hypothetical protein n=1 Tax=Streptomyces sp. NPDC059278 TaxID=3346801 RepID=UPI00368E3733
MKLTKAQQRAYDAMLAAPDGRIHSGSGQNIKRSTVEALARKNLATVTRKMDEKVVRHRNGTTTRFAVVTWTVCLKPVLPTTEQTEELDLILEQGERTLLPSQRKHAASYVALVAPSVAKEGAPVKETGYDPAAVYHKHIKLDPAHLLAAYMVVRTMSVRLNLPPGPSAAQGEPTDIWVLTEPGEAGEPGEELGRVRGAVQVEAKLCGNSLIDRRGGYFLRRLGANEVGPWIKDFRAGNTVLRLAREVDDEYVVTEVATGSIVTVRRTAAEAERSARTSIASPSAPAS